MSKENSCGNCCLCCVVGGEVEVTEKEYKRIVRFNPKYDSKKYFEFRTNGIYIRKDKHSNLACPFLRRTSCRIYDVRPKVCKDYDCRYDPKITVLKQELEI